MFIKRVNETSFKIAVDTRASIFPEKKPATRCKRTGRRLSLIIRTIQPYIYGDLHNKNWLANCSFSRKKLQNLSTSLKQPALVFFDRNFLQEALREKEQKRNLGTIELLPTALLSLKYSNTNRRLQRLKHKPFPAKTNVTLTFYEMECAIYK